MEALRRVDEDAIASAAGLAQRAGAPVSAAAAATPEDEEQAAARKEKIMARQIEIQWAHQSFPLRVP